MSFGLKLNLRLGIESQRNVVWTPAELGSSLALWFDASDASTITLSGSDVTQINDKLGYN